MYEEEKELMNKDFIVIRPWRVGGCTMRIGDRLTVKDYGSGMVSHFVLFTNDRLPRYKFKTATLFFKNRTRDGE